MYRLTVHYSSVLLAGHQVNGILCSASATGLGVLKADCKHNSGAAGISASSGTMSKRSCNRSITSRSSFGESAQNSIPDEDTNRACIQSANVAVNDCICQGDIICTEQELYTGVLDSHRMLPGAPLAAELFA